jgi:glutamine cyclotransferase
MSRGLAWAAVAALTVGGAIVALLNLTATPTLEPAGPLSPDPAAIRQYDVVAEYPHDPKALTQGLIYTGGFLYESIGRQGQSSIRKLELNTGRVIQQRAVDSRFFGEGLTEWRGQLIQLTPMRTRPNLIRALNLHDLKFTVASLGRYLDRDTGVRYDINSLEPQSTFVYNGEGWGLTHDDRQFIKSDGTSILRFLNPDTMKYEVASADSRCRGW